jgi:hypothetical protein
MGADAAVAPEHDRRGDFAGNRPFYFRDNYQPLLDWLLKMTAICQVGS